MTIIVEFDLANKIFLIVLLIVLKGKEHCYERCHWKLLEEVVI